MYLETESSPVIGLLCRVGSRRECSRRGDGGIIAKMYASDAARTVGNRGIQVHGGNGIPSGTPDQCLVDPARAMSDASAMPRCHR